MVNLIGYPSLGFGYFSIKELKNKWNNNEISINKEY
jgi:hypothetical protein